MREKNNIKNFQKKYSLKNEEFGKLLGVQSNTIMNYKKAGYINSAYSLIEIRKNDKFKNIPLEFFLGLTSSMEKENIELNKDLGLSDESIKVLKNLTNDSDNIRKKRTLFAVNLLIENMDFNKLGKIIAFPNYENKVIETDEFYKLYNKYYQENYYHNTYEDIERERDINDYNLSKMIVKICDIVRNSNQCIDLFKDLIKEKNDLIDASSYYNKDYYSEVYKDIDYSEIEYDNADFEEVVNKRKNDIGV